MEKITYAIELTQPDSPDGQWTLTSTPPLTEGQQGAVLFWVKAYVSEHTISAGRLLNVTTPAMLLKVNPRMGGLAYGLQARGFAPDTQFSITITQKS